MAAPAVDTASTDASEIVCVGEVLWDALPAGLFLGGAPYNVCYHLHTLGARAALVSRVGHDVLGQEIRRRMQTRAMTTDLVQVDPDRRTGFVEVAVDEKGGAAYTIVEPVAWDAIAWTEDLQRRARTSAAVVFGTLAQRSSVSRRTIRSVCEASPGVRVLDVNLRPPHVSREVVDASLALADVTKVNGDELRRLQDAYDLPPQPKAAVAALARRFDLRAGCVTYGGAGAGLWHDGTWTTHPGVDVAVEDTVGAGDAFLAALLDGLLTGVSDADVLDRACRLGAFVATKAGATPTYSRERVIGDE